MWKLARMLTENAYQVVNIHYPSRKFAVDGLVQYLHDKIAMYCNDPSRKVHFVTHSLGGILVRAYVKAYPPVNLGRVVMLSPPNHGSELVDIFREHWWFRRFFGPIRHQLGTDSNSVPNTLGAVNFELGVITGNRSINLIGSALIRGPNDGTVSVERARVEGMRDFLVVPYGHTFIMRRKAVAAQTVQFLRAGHFQL
jgi:triacylglycerol lipase